MGGNQISEVKYSKLLYDLEIQAPRVHFIHFLPILAFCQSVFFKGNLTVLTSYAFIRLKEKNYKICQPKDPHHISIIK